MRIKALIIVLVMAAAIGGAYLLISDRPLASDELAQVKQACPTCHGRVPVYNDFHLVHNVHISFDCGRCHEAEAKLVTGSGTPTPTVIPTTTASATHPTTTSSPASTTGPTTTATPSEPFTETATITVTETTTSATVASGPPNIPHTLTDRDNCLGCHVTNTDHAGRTNEMCRLCHTTQ